MLVIKATIQKEITFFKLLLSLLAAKKLI